MRISITCLFMVIKCWFLDNYYIIYMMIFYLGWSMVQGFTYEQIECKKNKSSVQLLIDWRSKQCMRSQKYRRIRIKYLHFVFDIDMIAWKWMDYRLYYCIEQSNVSLTVRWLFKYWDFVQCILRLLSTIGVNLLLVTWKTVDSLLLSMWAEFLRWAKNIGFWKGSKKFTAVCVKIERICEIPRKNELS